MANSILKEALRYLERGWSVIPVGKDKQTLHGVRWKPYQQKQPTREQVTQWFTEAPGANVAVILGHVSGNLVCRDFDDESAYWEWRRQYPNLAKRLPTARTARGHHVYFQASVATRTRKFEDGELRGEGGYVILPPSVHESGAIYRWEIPPGRTIPEADPAIFCRSFLPEAARSDVDVTERAQTSETSERTETVESSETIHRDEGKEHRFLSIPDTLDEAVSSTLPSGPGQRHHCLFWFCRTLKAMPEYCDAEAQDLWDVFTAWFDRAEPFITTKDPMVSWDEFCDGWKRVILPIGENPMNVIVEAAKNRKPPSILARYKSTGLSLLANVCAEFQDRAGGGCFFLSSRTAGKFLGVEPMTAWRYLRRLEKERLLSCAEKGRAGQNGKATRWRFLGNGDAPSA